MKIIWDDTEDEVTTADHLINILTGLTVDRGGGNAIGVELIKDDGEMMTAVLCRDCACLGWYPAESDGVTSYHTVKDGFDPESDKVPENPELITYQLQGHHGEIPIEYTIPLDLALEAVVRFFNSQGRPDRVRWDMD